MDNKWKDRLTSRMVELGLNMKSLSLKSKHGETFVYDILRRRNAPGIDGIIAIADALGVSLNWLLYGDGDRIQRPVSGIVGAGQQVVPLDNLDEQPHPDMVTVPISLGAITIVQVRGDSMKPRYESGDLVAYGPPAQDLADAMGKECIVRLRDGTTYLKRVKSGTEPQTAILLSTNADPLVNVKLDWAAPLVDWIKRGYDSPKKENE